MKLGTFLFFPGTSEALFRHGLCFCPKFTSLLKCEWLGVLHVFPEIGIVVVLKLNLLQGLCTSFASQKNPGPSHNHVTLVIRTMVRNIDGCLNCLNWLVFDGFGGGMLNVV